MKIIEEIRITKEEEEEIMLKGAKIFDDILSQLGYHEEDYGNMIADFITSTSLGDKQIYRADGERAYRFKVVEGEE